MAAAAYQFWTGPARKRSAPNGGGPFVKKFGQSPQGTQWPAGMQRQAQVLQRAPRPELKGVDTNVDSSDIIATTGTNADILTLNLVQAGNGSWNRVGRKIRLKSVRVTGRYELESLNEATTGNMAGATLRICLLWDKQPSSNAVPAFDEIFGSTGQDGAEGTTIFDPLRFDNTARFSVLRDKLITINPKLNNQNGGTGDSTKYYKWFDEYVKLQGREVLFSGQSQPMTIADISTGALYLIYRASETPTSAAISAVVDSNARLRYTDA